MAAESLPPLITPDYRFSTDDLRQVHAFISHLNTPGTCHEIRTFKTDFVTVKTDVIHKNMIGKVDKYQKSISFWSDDPRHTTQEIRRIHDASVYVTVNPVQPIFLSRAKFFTVIEKKKGTADEHITAIRWLYIDVDAEKPKGFDDVSATDAERENAAAVLDDIFVSMKDIHASTLWGSSGNGYWLLIRLVDLPNNEESRQYIATALDLLHARFSRPGFAKVDVKTKNPSRVMTIPGTMKTKGTHTLDRPHRRVTQEDGLERDPVPLAIQDVIAMIPAAEPTIITFPESPAPAENDEASPEGHQTERPSDSTSAYRETAYDQCVHYCQSIPGSISGQNGHDNLYSVAMACREFDLSVTDTRRIIDDFNTRCDPEWSEGEIAHKISEAAKNCTNPGYRFTPPTPRHGRRQTIPIRPNSPDTPPPEPTVDVDALTKLVDDLIAANKAEAVYRSAELMEKLAVLEHENPVEYQVIRSRLQGIKGFKIGAFDSIFSKYRAGQKSDAFAPREGGPETPTFEFSDMGNAARLGHLHGDKIRYNVDTKDWMFFDTNRWTPNAIHHVQRLAKDIPGQVLAEMPPTMDEETIKAFKGWSLASQAVKKRNYAIQDAQSDYPIRDKELDANPWLWNCANGTIDLQTGKLRPHRRGDHCTKLSPVPYDPNAKCPLIDKFLNDVMAGDQEKVAYMDRRFGYAMTGIVDEQDMDIFYGEGSNGKDLLKILQRWGWGDYSWIADPDLLLATHNPQHPTGLAALQGRRLVFVSETDEGRRINESVFKKITGEDEITARYMGKDFFNYRATFKLILATNHKPKANADDGAVWRRIKLVGWPVKFVDETDPEPVKPPFFMEKNKQLKNALKAELPGLMARYVRGCLEWQRNGMQPPASILAATAEYRAEQDVIDEYLSDSVTRSENGEVPAHSLYKDYESWCERKRRKPVSSNQFGRLLTKKGFKIVEKTAGNWRAGLRLGRPEVTAWLEEFLIDGSAKLVFDILTAGEGVGFDRHEIYQAASGLQVQMKTNPLGKAVWRKADV